MLTVLDDDGRVVGLLSDSDLLLRHGRLHVPTIFTLFGERGSCFTFPSLEAFATELRKALGSTVGELMDPDPATCGEDETVEDVA
ncbi:MAG: CBS domain-containing protein, partial [Acidimicrobiales bacterium]